MKAPITTVLERAREMQKKRALRMLTFYGGQTLGEQADKIAKIDAAALIGEQIAALEWAVNPTKMEVKTCTELLERIAALEAEKEALR